MSQHRGTFEAMGCMSWGWWSKGTFIEDLFGWKGTFWCTQLYWKACLEQLSNDIWAEGLLMSLSVVCWDVLMSQDCTRYAWRLRDELKKLLSCLETKRQIWWIGIHRWKKSCCCWLERVFSCLYSSLILLIEAEGIFGSASPPAPKP